MQQSAALQESILDARLQETASYIAKKCFQLLEIYQINFLDQVPTELLKNNKLYFILYKLATEFAKQPDKLLEVQRKLYEECAELYNNTLSKNQFADNRFQHPDWENKAYFNFVKRIYLLINKYVQDFIADIEELDRKELEHLQLYVKNIMGAISPSNFFFANPELLRATFESGGERLLEGIKNFLDDLVNNNGNLGVSITDLSAFTVGQNIAITPGKVIYQNDLMQLIQYTPTTKEVYATPILFIPPWINKYYILDLTPEKSLVKWLLDQGFTVFMISWANPGPELFDKKFENYMLEGPLTAINVITSKLRCNSVHMAGYCIGGTLLSCTLAYMKRRYDKRAITGSYFTTLLDFSEPGELGVFIDEYQLNLIEQLMNAKGYLDGRLLNIAFHMLRPNDLIWPYFVNNYLLGQKPRAFDLFYWNSDSTNLVSEMYNFYLRNMYLYNNLRKPGGITLDNVSIDLKEIFIPVFFISTEKDHIAPWQSTYAGVHLHGGPVTFVLAGSGHIAGIVNPPHKNKYGYRINENLVHTAKEWYETSEQHEGSWWPRWRDWLIQYDSNKIPARDPGTSGFSIIEDAPGSYVKKRI